LRRIFLSLIESPTGSKRSPDSDVDPVITFTFEDLCMFETMQIYLLQLINRFRRNEDGAALAEYGLLVALIAVVCVTVIQTLGTSVSTAFSKIASAIGAA
jgi:pilus assembly protein Flp/PilA